MKNITLGPKLFVVEVGEDEWMDDRLCYSKSNAKQQTTTFIKFFLKNKICKSDEWRIGFEPQLGQGSFLSNNFEEKKL